MKVTFARVLRSEWIKLTTLRSTWILMAVLVILMVTVSGLIGWRASNDPNAEHTPTLAAARAFLSVDIASLIVGVFGILLWTGDGAIRSTLAAVPKRLPVLAAKALAFVALMLPLMAVTSVAALIASQAQFFPARATVGAAVAPVALGLIGLGIGAMVRHTAIAITTYVGVLLVIPALLPAVLPDRLQNDLIPLVPVAASQSLYAVGGTDGGGGLELLSPGPAALALAAWIVALLVGGAVVLKRRDAS